MHTLRLLGRIQLSDGDGREVDALLRQPKHIALLAYIALPRVGTWHRRDSIVATFWPDHDQARARAALRSALYTVRHHLPDGAIPSRGDDEVCIAPDFLETDVDAIAQAIDAGDPGDALARYRGELLEALYVPDAPGFDKWVDEERKRIRRIAGTAAGQLSEALEKNGDLARAIAAARTGAELDPDDEGATRRWIALLDRAGDRAQAFAVYEKFRNHMSAEFGVRPSAETVALLDAVRTRHQPGSLGTVSHEPVGSAPSPSHGSDSPATPARQGATSVDERAKSHGIRWWWFATPVAITAAVVLGMSSRRASNPTAAPSSSNVVARSLVVLPMTNETGNQSLAYVASGLADGVARRLEGLGGITVRSGARSDWKGSITRYAPALARQFGPTVVLRSSLRQAGDSLEVTGMVIDGTTMEERSIARLRFSVATIGDAESRFAASIAGAVFRKVMPVISGTTDRRVNPESYRLTLQGLHRFLSNVEPPPVSGRGDRYDDAQRLFMRALNIDPLNARAWTGLASVLGARTVTDRIPFDEGYDRATAAAAHALAIDSLQGPALATMGLLRALKEKDIAAGSDLVRKAEAAEPSNPEVFLIKHTLLRSAHRFEEALDAIRVARQLDPLSSTYLDKEADTDLCMNQPEAALSLYRSELTANPSDRLSKEGLRRSLARLGRFDEAIAEWRTDSAAAADTSLARVLSNAKGKEGYWQAAHLTGRKRLAALRKNTGRISPLGLVQATFASGDSAGGYVALAKAQRAGTATLYRLPCMPEIEEFRDTPSFKAAVDRIGAIRSH